VPRALAIDGRRHAVCLAATIQLTFTSALAAQPWVPPQGEGTVSLTYQNYYTLGHFDAGGRENTNGATHTKTLVAEIDYALTDNVAISVSLPFVASKYTGPPEYIVGGVVTHPGPLDDGTYHGTFQDVHVEVRRVWWAGPIAVAPFLGGTIPTHDYETHGEAVAGRHRREGLIGASGGADLTPWVPAVYVHSSYALAIAEPQHGFQSVKSNINVETGYVQASWIALRALADWQIAHRGPTIRELAADDWLGHDRLIVSSHFALGGGVTLSMTRTLELNALWIATISGGGGAHRARTLAVGTSWTFGSGMKGFAAPATVSESRSRSTRQAPESGR
jgi:hypothetical protein